MATHIGVGSSDSSDSDSGSSSSSNSSILTEVKYKLVKPQGQSFEENPSLVEETPKRNKTKKPAAAIKNKKAGKSETESKESRKEEVKPLKSVSLLKGLISKNKKRALSLNKKLTLVLKAVSGEQRLNKTAQKKLMKK